MTLGTTTPVIEYVENGATLEHAIPFQFRNSSEILCYRRDQDTDVETLLTQGSDFTVAGGGNSYAIGTVTKASGGVSGDIFIIKRSTPRSQPTDYTPGDDFPAETHEQALDRLTAIIQEIEAVMVTTETVREVMMDILAPGAGITLTEDEDADTITIAATMDAEAVRDTVATFIQAGTGIEVAHNDSANTFTITNSSELGAVLSDLDFLMLSGDQQGGLGGDGATSAEAVRDIVATFIQAGTGIDVTHDDGANTFTIDCTVTGGLVAEQVYDLMHASIVAGNGLDRAIDDGADTITLSLDPILTSVEEVPILAAAMKPRASNGCAALASAETSVNKVNYDYLAFDGAVIERAQIIMPMPPGWNEGTLQAAFDWAAPDAGTPGEIVRWGFRAVAISNDDPIDSAFGAATTVEDAVTADGDWMTSAFTPATTVGGTPAEADRLVLEFFREADHANDTLNAIDAHLISVMVKMTRSERDDA